MLFKPEMTVGVRQSEQEPPTFRVSVIASPDIAVFAGLCVRLLGSYIFVSPETGGRIVSTGLQRLIIIIIIILTTQLLCCTKQCSTLTVCPRTSDPVDSYFTGIAARSLACRSVGCNCSISTVMTVIIHIESFLTVWDILSK
jgi:hypothetical protein